MLHRASLVTGQKVCQMHTDVTTDSKQDSNKKNSETQDLAHEVQGLL